MTTGLPLFDAADGELRKQASIRRIAAAQEDFTSDELQAVLQERPPAPAAVGAAFAAAAKAGICEGTEKFRKSARPEARRRRIQAWRRCG